MKLYYGGSQLDLVDDHSFLGVTFQSNLSWSRHVNTVRMKVAKSIGMLNRFRNFLTTKLKRELYFSVIHSHFSYCLLVWGTGNKTDNEKLSSLQRKAVRLLHSGYNIHSSELMLKYKIPPFCHIYKIKLSMYIYCEVSGDWGSFTRHYLNRNTGHDLRKTRIVLERTRTNYGMQAIDCQVMRLCNEHPEIMEMARSCTNSKNFKLKIRSFFKI